MSGHLIGCVKSIGNLGKSHKLALVAFADSADDRTHVAFPGYEGVQTWATCSKSRAAELIKDLVAAGYLKLHKTARPGRRAEYIVFPDGCCELHRTPGDEDTQLDVEALAQASGVPVEAVSRLIEAMTIQPPNVSENSDTNGYEISDPSHGDGSEKSDTSTGVEGYGSEISDSNTVRIQNVSENSDPFTPTNPTNSPRRTTEVDAREPDPNGRDQHGPLSPYCREHPLGTSKPCAACEARRERFEDAERRRADARRRAANDDAIQAERRRKAETADVDGGAHAAEARKILASSRAGGGEE